MACAPAAAPVFWQRQPRLPLPVLRFLGARMEAALRSPAHRSLLVWPMVLGAPGLRDSHPDGVPEPELLARAGALLGPLGVADPAAAWADALERLPDTADRGPAGWVPHRIWEPLGSLVSLRLGVALLALVGQPEDGRYGLACGTALFNSGLFHECHDALEPLWLGAAGELRTGLQGLILLAGGFHHLQLDNPGGMISLWRDALPALERFPGILATPWGAVGFSGAAAAAAERLRWLDGFDGDMALDPLWAMSRPVLELT
jgi:hypothetical protein